MIRLSQISYIIFIIMYCLRCENVGYADPGSVASSCPVVHTFFSQDSQGIVRASYLHEGATGNDEIPTSKPKPVSNLGGTSNPRGMFLLGKHQIYMSHKEITLPTHSEFITTPSHIELFQLSTPSLLKGVTSFNQQSLRSIDTLITHMNALYGSLHETVTIQSLPVFVASKYTLAQINETVAYVAGTAHPSHFLSYTLIQSCTGHPVGINDLFHHPQHALTFIAHLGANQLNQRYHTQGFHIDDISLTPTRKHYPVIVPYRNGLYVYIEPDNFGNGFLNFTIPCSRIQAEFNPPYQNTCDTN